MAEAQQQQQQQQQSGAQSKQQLLSSSSSSKGGSSTGAASSVMRRLMGFVAMAAMGGSLATGGGVAVATVAVMAGMATPMVLFLSPILVPMAIAVTVATTGLMAAGAGLVGVVMGVTWMQSYRKGRRPMGGDQAQSLHKYLGGTVKDTAHGFTDRVAGVATSAAHLAADATKAKSPETATSPSS